MSAFTKMWSTVQLAASGFLVLPERLLKPWHSLGFVVDRHSPTFEQAILAEFILDGHFGHHVRRIRQIYSERGSVLVEIRQKLINRPT
jgi:GntR family transcriptional regulator / MocR family aminotransferase